MFRGFDNSCVKENTLKKLIYIYIYVYIYMLRVMMDTRGFLSANWHISLASSITYSI